ncbi:3-oxoacyl-ACP reductase FabG [Streptomyces sp. NPDC049967]|uniref:3-oxoacyl-ACP reductase FabG n=1 Tax=unclassified Streptomyces TaxID=2593676 RepID=UPI00093AEB5B|nr:MULTISPECIES: 3-oxoacyl-ACP reductase FabG [unclassified Streptomyces]NED81215.1 SDR family oxidoreductase [Streptomyces sp. SID11233]OKK15395.1 3-oxoacyl-ACP reductase [Streptomyces sp. CB02488]WRZ12329.1 3-oxoacyl-ACP reductase FabG [Streptomyces sp. NBC_00341]WSJ23335.1 3-oxoacyl-ACP reductase FabG [Streptomyces sp. NBC_01324]
MSRSVLVTGGNRGIGLATARALAAEGHKVAITYRNGEPPPGFFAVRCDVTDPAQIKAAVEAVSIQQGDIEILVSNAGITRDQLLIGMPEDDFRAVMETNFQGAVSVTRAVVPAMIKARWGRLIYMSSINSMSGAPGQTNYASSKAALIGFARSLAIELGRRNITVNVVAPGMIETDMVENVTDARRKAALARTALARTGTPEEVAAAARFLAGEDASYVTAGVIPVTGGLGAGH